MAASDASGVLGVGAVVALVVKFALVGDAGAVGPAAAGVASDTRGAGVLGASVVPPSDVVESFLNKQSWPLIFGRDSISDKVEVAETRSLRELVIAFLENESIFRDTS